MTYESLALLLMLVGFALIVAEVFIPSGGMILILCVISFACSIWFAYKAWWGISGGYFWTFITALGVLIPGVVIGLFQLIDRTSMGDRMLLGAPRLEEVTPYQAEIMRLSALVGKRGEALTLMNPGGMVLVDGDRLHAVCEGAGVETGSPIEVIGVRGTRVVVRPYEEPRVAPQPPPRPLAQIPDPPPPAPLDFDLPHG